MKFFTNLTLWKKISLLTTVGLLLGVAVFSSLGMRAVNQATETMLRDRLTTAQLVADYLDESLGRAVTELQRTTRLIDSSNNNLEAELESLSDAYSRLLMSVYSIYLLNEQGQIVWCQPDNPGVMGLNLTPYLNNAGLDGEGRAGISGLASAPATNTPVVFLASLIGDSTDNRDILVVAVDVSKSSIGGFIKPIRLGQTGYVEIVDQNGIVVTRTEPGPKLSLFEKSDHSGRFAALITAGAPTQGVCHTCHEPEQKVNRKDVLAFVPLSKARWGVVVRQSEDEALASTRELRQNLFLFGGGLVFIALGFVLITTRNIGSRISSLTGAAGRIANGDLVSPITAAGRDEVGILAQTFEDMRTKLKTSYGELEQRTGELASLLSVLEILTSNPDLSQLLQAVVAKAVEIIPGADGGVLLLRKEQDGITIQCSLGIDVDKLGWSDRQNIGSSYTNLNSSTSDKTDVNVAQQQVSTFLKSEAWRKTVRSYISADILHRKQYLGCLIMVNCSDAQGFSEADSRLLQAIADNIAIAIEREQLAKDAEEARALQELDRLRSQFISSVSHELRTPLTLIKGYTTSLLRHDITWDYQSQSDFLKIVDEKTDELRDLIDKLLQSAKLEAGALKLEREPVLINRLVDKVVEDMRLRGKNHRLTVKLADNIPVVEADVRLIEQVISNLIENAIKYSPEGSEIVIAGERRNDSVVVSVSDTGPGIPPEHQRKVFERFYRAPGQLTRSTGGTGLGLSIVKGHVEAHGGQVWLESTVGSGSTFYFSLPIDVEEVMGKDEEGGKDER